MSAGKMLPGKCW